jgi:hypothetical protein
MRIVFGIKQFSAAWRHEEKSILDEFAAVERGASRI